MVNPTDFYSEEAYEEALADARAPLATPADAVREYAANAGAMQPDREWILTPYDSWERNPCYSGPPQRHPEEDPED
jgi:hypothetical protein